MMLDIKGCLAFVAVAVAALYGIYAVFNLIWESL